MRVKWVERFDALNMSPAARGFLGVLIGLGDVLETTEADMALIFGTDWKAAAQELAERKSVLLACAHGNVRVEVLWPDQMAAQRARMRARQGSGVGK